MNKLPEKNKQLKIQIIKSQNPIENRVLYVNIPAHFDSTSIISGNLDFTSDVRIDGKIIGNVIGSEKVIIGPGASFKGKLKARTLIIFGNIDGEICISEETILHPGSSVRGTLLTKTFTLHEGALLTAKVLTCDNTQKYFNNHLNVPNNTPEKAPSVQPLSVINEQRVEMPQSNIAKHDKLIKLHLKEVNDLPAEPAPVNMMKRMFDQLNKELDSVENIGVKPFF